MTTDSLTVSNPASFHVPEQSKTFGVAGFVSIWLVGVYTLLAIVPTFYELSMLFCILTTLIAPLLYKYLVNDLDIFEPLVYANIALASMFLGRPIYDLFTNTWLHEWFATFFDARPGFDNMLFYALLGIVALQLGYASALPRLIAEKMPRYTQGIKTDRLIVVAWWMFVVGAILFEEYIRQSGGIAFLAAYLTSRSLGTGFSYKAASGYLFIGPLFWPPAAMIALSAWLKTKKSSQLFLVVLSLSCFFISVLGGVGRTFTIQGIIGIVVITYISRNKRPGMLLVLPALFAGLLFAVYDRESRFKTTYAAKEMIMQKIVAHPMDALVTIWSEDDAAESDYFDVLVANIPSRVAYGNGSSVTDTLLRAYPRFLWENKKPDEHMVLLFKKFFPAVYYRYSTGAASTIISEFYVDHGAITIILGMFALGVVLGIPKRWMQFANGTLPTQLLFVAMPAYTISVMRGGLPNFIQSLAITFVPIFLIGRYAQQRDDI